MRNNISNQIVNGFCIWLISNLVSCLDMHDLPESIYKDTETDQSPEYDTVSLIPEDGTQLIKEDNDYHIQGPWYYYKDGDGSSFDTDQLPKPIRDPETGRWIIKTSGTVHCNQDEEKGWGVGFGIELCASDADDFEEDLLPEHESCFGNEVEAKEKELKAGGTTLQDWRKPHHCVPEYTYPLEWCPFNDNLHKQIRGVELEIEVEPEQNGFGKLMIQFKQGSEIKDDDHPRCFVYDNEYKEELNEEDKEEPLCTEIEHYKEDTDDVWHVKALFKDDSTEDRRIANKNRDGVIPELIRAIHIQIVTGKLKETRPFSFTLRKFILLLEDNNAPYIPSTDISQLKLPGPTVPITPPCKKQQCPIDDEDWVELTDFDVMKKEATVLQVHTFLEAIDRSFGENDIGQKWYSCNLYRYKKSPEEETLKNQSANCIEFDLADAFCQWIAGSDYDGNVPTERQWKVVARSGQEEEDIGDYPWNFDGNKDPATSEKVVMDNSTDEPQIGCSLGDNVGTTKQRVCDMAGNLAEWTRLDLKNASGFKKIKGGSLYSSKETVRINSVSMEYKVPYNYNRMGVRCIRIKNQSSSSNPDTNTEPTQHTK